MLVLFETSAGYAIFNLKKAGVLENVEDIVKMFESEESAKKAVKLVAFKAFSETKLAVESLNSLFNGELPKDLKKFLKKNIISKEIEENMMCYDKKTAKLIKKEMGIECVYSENYLQVFRGIRGHLTSLIEGINETEFKNSSVGLSHNYYRYKLKFNVDKVDLMVIQAVGLIDDLDKELNNLAMRLREWYGWHFPECGKLVADNLTFAKIVAEVGMRSYMKSKSLSELVPEDLEQQIKEAAEISMGSEISVEDELNIIELCIQIIQLYDYRASLVEYLKTRMKVVAPNLTELIGEMVAARLIAHSGSLINLAKQPASTIQIFGAEKALFRALRTKHDTPKYGLIYHASIVSSASTKLKGKISRSLASKAALCVRVDALHDNPDGAIGIAKKAYLENRIKMLEKGGSGLGTKGAGLGSKTPKYNSEENSKKKVYNNKSAVALKKDESDDDSSEDKVVVSKKHKKSKDSTMLKKKRAKKPVDSDDDSSE
jgi:nucleolar protein 58